MPLKWKKNAQIINLKFEASGDKAWLNSGTLVHMFTGIVFFSMLKTATNINDTCNIIIMSTLHIIEDYLENTSPYSLEAVFGNVIGCTNKGFIEPNDHDCLQNFITDNIAFCIGNIIGAFLYKTEFFKQNIKFNVVVLIFVCFLAILTIYCHARK